ncbi:MAG: hypothetical protein OS130_10110 [Thermodesulfobacteriota bacterium]|jgi:hypothetical protein|nr:MAG: hypothetical protein OS130_10110 [Thermodesulfobacteriota bacterium]
MSKKKIFIDSRQKDLDFTAKIETYQRAKEEILKACATQQPAKAFESYEEACIEVAASVKKSMRAKNLSRDQMVDAINQYFGDSKKPLSTHIFNHYLSKPTRYPMPAYLVYAVQQITESLEIAKSFAAAEDAKVITGCELRELALGKIEEHITEVLKLKRELKLKG